MIIFQDINQVSKISPARFEAAIVFFSKILFYENREKLNGVCIRIDLDKESAVPNAYGFLIQENDKEFTIWIRKTRSVYTQLLTLAHEMVHIKQVLLDGYMIDEMEMRKNEGDNIITPDPYWDCPWEIEAYGREKGLVDRFLLFGQ